MISAGVDIPRKAPALFLRPKSTEGPCDEARVISRVVEAARGVGTTLPVVFGRRTLGWVRSEYGSPWVDWLPYDFATSYDDIVNFSSVNGNMRTIHWQKNWITTTYANAWYDLFGVYGSGGVGAYSFSANTAIQHDDTALGGIYHGGNVSTSIKLITGCWQAANGTSPVAILYDRVLTYEACTLSGSSQNMTNTLTAQRYAGNTQSGLQICVTAQTAIGAQSNVTAIVYVSNLGTTGRNVPTTSTLAINIAPAQNATAGAGVAGPFQANAVTQTSPFMPLAAGDTGAQSITSYNIASTTGTICFVLLKPLAWMILSAGQASQICYMQDLVNSYPAMERVYDSACLTFLAYSPTSTSHCPYGAFNVVWG